jgi:hydroxyacylglutathione hydrolase
MRRFHPHLVASALSAQDMERLGLPAVDTIVGEGDEVRVGALKGGVLETPGHRYDHVSYVFSQAHVAFCGDVLFKMGCGRAEAGQAHVLWASIQKLLTLPDEMYLSCGHDYMLTNLKFALSLAPDPDTRHYLIQKTEEESARAPLTSRSALTECSTLADEKRYNPFLSFLHPSQEKGQEKGKEALNLPRDASSQEIFIALRALKEAF